MFYNAKVPYCQENKQTQKTVFQFVKVFMNCLFDKVSNKKCLFQEGYIVEGIFIITSNKNGSISILFQNDNHELFKEILRR